MTVDTSDDGRPLRVSLTAMPFRKTAVQSWANRRLSPEAVVGSDALGSVKAGLAAEPVHHPACAPPCDAHWQRTRRRRACPMRWVNVVLGNLKTAIAGTYHAFKFTQYAPRYLAEVQYRFNRRFDLQVILRRLVRAAATTEPYPQSRSG